MVDGKYTTRPTGIVVRATAKTGYKIYLLFSNTGIENIGLTEYI